MKQAPGHVAISLSYSSFTYQSNSSGAFLQEPFSVTLCWLFIVHSSAEPITFLWPYQMFNA